MLLSRASLLHVSRTGNDNHHPCLGDDCRGRKLGLQPGVPRAVLLRRVPAPLGITPRAFPRKLFQRMVKVGIT